MVFNRCKTSLPLVGVLVMLGAASVQADPLDLKDLDNSIFEHLRAKASSNVDITLDGTILKMGAALLSGRGDEDAARIKKLVAALKSVTVRSFEFKEKGAYTSADVDAIRAQLKGSEWTRIVGAQSKEEGDRAEIYVLPGKEKPQGLFILATEPLELTVVQILGAIEVSDLAALEDLGVPDLSRGHGAKGDK